MSPAQKTREIRDSVVQLRMIEYIDLSKVGKEGLKQICRQVVRLKGMGKSGKEIVGVRQNGIGEIRTVYQREVEASFERKNMGGNWVPIYAYAAEDVGASGNL